ncbi:hypothetical protein MLD38_022522 [Melastoma candidum]|uniref:Uncharacterized protein n=1 Tax=Melastoma candidum TaxID=119954 RepID=A0ACB9QJP6_9MYRT|nr:hypothetical protein MLD38_022522 [Melastoma candidum]
MSAKWRAIQHRHRYTYGAVIFPRHYLETLALIETFSPSLHKELTHLASLSSTYAQVAHARTLAAAFSGALLDGELIGLDGREGKALVKAYIEIMFFENSLPLHKMLVSPLGKCREEKGRDLIRGCFRELCEEYWNGRGKRFSVSRAVLSVMGLQKLGFLMAVVEDCAVFLAKDVVNGLRGVVEENFRDNWARPSPIVMEQCQESLSCLYYLLQRCPSKFQEPGGESYMEMIFGVILCILKLPSFSRDCFVAAGVCFCAGLQVCLDPEELGLFIVEGVFFKRVVRIDTLCANDNGDISSKFPYSGDMFSEIRGLSLLSRLCLIRGILTAVDRHVLNIHLVVEQENLSDKVDLVSKDENSIWTILYDGILPELCDYCENPTDSHFNFHALTVLQICLQQIKTSLLAKVGIFSEQQLPIQEETGTRILRILWNNLEDPLSQTVKQVQLVFELFLDIQSTLQWEEGSDKVKSFLRKIASHLLHLGPRCKGRYVPLATVTKRLGAITMLDMNKALITETVQAYIDDDVCCAATSFFKCFLENLRDEFWKNDGVSMGYVLFRTHCLPPLLYGLASGISKLRSNLSTYALPVLLEVDTDSIFSMLSFISIVPSTEDHEQLPSELDELPISVNTEQKVAVMISLLKVSRTLAFMEGDIDWYRNPVATQNSNHWLKTNHVSPYALVCVKGIDMKIQVEWLMLALTNEDESLRVDAAELLFLNPKTASLPSHLELALMKEAIPLNMRCSSTAFQMKWSSLFRKFFARVRTALERQLKQKSWQPLLSGNNNGFEDVLVSRANELFSFMRWLSAFLFFSCYPSAPYKRKIMAMELILIMADVWPIKLPFQDDVAQTDTVICLYPYGRGITSPNLTTLLVGSVIDSWDKIRDSSFRILLHFPTPLPGFSSEVMVVKVLKWARKLVCSPRVRESDAGALSMRLLFRKYVLELGWSVEVSENITAKPQSLPEYRDSMNHEGQNPVITYIGSLINWLDAVVKDGERDLSEACQKSFVHGVLLTLRYTFEELDWNSNDVLSCITDMRQAVKKLLELVLRITSVALWVVSANAWSLHEMDEMDDDDEFILECPGEMSNIELPPESDKSFTDVIDTRLSEQAVMVACWLAMKEVSLLIGTIIRKIPLPSSPGFSPSNPDGAILDACPDTEESVAVLDLKQLEALGNHFLEVLLRMKHNGAIDKTRAGFTALCNRLLCSNDPRLCKLTESWMEKLMERTIAKGQVVDDLLRRSAGIPAAFIALFLSEPEGTPKKLLPRALRWLINIAKCPIQDVVESSFPNGVSCNTSELSNTDEKSSKIRDEGVIPVVHAFNVLRITFNDANLAADTSGFSAEAMIVSIHGFSSPYWEVRNGACLAYTALVRRMIGFLNVQKRESARRSLTGLEFFHRYPLLHPFLLDELKIATASLEDESMENAESSLAKVVHPSLCPMLILLSRLKPSALASEIGDNLDPFIFMPFIRKCSTQRNMKIRILAARALTGLISNEKLPIVIMNIASELSSLAKGEGKNTFNLIHGLLLQISSLLDVNCRNLSDPVKIGQILGDLTRVLSECSWIGKIRLCPCPILNTSFLRMLDLMLCTALGNQSHVNFTTIRDLVLELTSECLHLEQSYDLPFYDPSHSELLQQSASSYLRCFFYPSESSNDNNKMPESRDLAYLSISEHEPENDAMGFQDLLVRCFSSTSYEVRLSSLKWLMKILDMTKSDSDSGSGVSRSIILSFKKWASVNLQETLLRRLDLETHHKCRYYILRVFFAWNSQQIHGSIISADIKFVGVMDQSSTLLLWKKLMFLYNSVRHAKSRQMLICCMGICMRRMTDFFSSSLLKGEGEFIHPGHMEVQGRLYEYLFYFHELIKEHSSPSEPVNMRSAAVDSIIASGLLEQAEVIGPSLSNGGIPLEISNGIISPEGAVGNWACIVLRTWLTCIRLLEDEDDGIRQKLASSVQKCFTRKMMNDTGFFPRQADKVIVSSFKYLSSIFGPWIEYFNYLSEYAFDMARPPASSGSDLVRRVFDKEIDNHHEEKLLICQICCCHLEKLSRSSPWAVDKEHEGIISNLLNDRRMRFYEQLISFTSDNVLREDGVDWIGSVGNHKDAFLPLYANLLGFYTFSKGLLHRESGRTDDSARLLRDVVNLGESISPFLQNPLIGSLYSLVVDLHESELGATVDFSSSPDFRTDSSLWEGFDPYFLIG